MQIVIDESLDGEDFESYIGEVFLTKDKDGRIYFKWITEGISTEIGVDLPDILKFIQEEMVHND